MSDEAALRGAWHGAWLFAWGRSRFIPPFSGAVALVEAPGLPDVLVQQDGQNLGATDHEGRLVATTLRAFDSNAIRLDNASLPLEGWIESDERVVRPYARGVLAVRFASSADSLSLRLRQRDGSPVPVGARVVEPAGGWPVGDRGLVSLPGDGGLQHLRVEWPGGSCRVDVPSVPVAEARCE